ncbi:unnamed protein product [Miscanthus lutarioriparius]|uniref:Uncharacterized protein n=1 Tax=Miscanthus lutarioriparius TaxID=422564 RepID=A0A811RL75_9POAL|nr:unnamed protein product [Miscanthus lutarioriparius]
MISVRPSAAAPQQSRARAISLSVCPSAFGPWMGDEREEDEEDLAGGRRVGDAAAKRRRGGRFVADGGGSEARVAGATRGRSREVSVRDCGNGTDHTLLYIVQLVGSKLDFFIYWQLVHLTVLLVVDRVPELDLKRTFVFTLLGLALVGPTLHVWYLYLSKLVAISGASGAIARLLLDQFIFSPIFIGVFMSLLVTLEGNPSLVVPKLKQEWLSSVLANKQLWIPFQFLNFYFVPQKLQVLAANFVALAWNVILSFKAHKEIVAKQVMSTAWISFS